MESICHDDVKWDVYTKHDSYQRNYKTCHPEQQFLNADVTRLQQFATNSNGTAYFMDNIKALPNDLISDSRFITIQKSNKNVVPLIDWKFLLGIITLSLGLEWFIRKYNGLI